MWNIKIFEYEKQLLFAVLFCKLKKGVDRRFYKHISNYFPAENTFSTFFSINTCDIIFRKRFREIILLLYEKLIKNLYNFFGGKSEWFWKLKSLCGEYMYSKIKCEKVAISV